MLFALLTFSQVTAAFQREVGDKERMHEIKRIADSVLTLRKARETLVVHSSLIGQIGYKDLMGEYNMVLAIEQLQKSEYDSALKYVEVSKGFIEETTNNDLKSTLYTTQGLIEYNKSDFASAREHLNEVQDLKTSTNTRVYWLLTKGKILTTERDSIEFKKLVHEVLAMTENSASSRLKELRITTILGYVQGFLITAKYDSAKYWIDKAKFELKGIPPRNKKHLSIGLVEANYFLLTANYTEALNSMLKLEPLIRESSKPEHLSKYLQLWIRLYIILPQHVAEERKNDLLYQPNEIIEQLYSILSDMRLSEQIETLTAIRKYQIFTGDYMAANSTADEIIRLEHDEFIVQMTKGFNSEKELMQTKADASEKLRAEQLAKARANQRLYISAILLVLIIGYFVYRNAIHRKKQNLVLSDKNQLITQQKEDIQHINELKSKFFINISHELRTPLTLVLGQIKNTLKGNYGSLNERQNQSLNTASANSQRILSLVQNMLDLSKIESGKEHLKAKKVDLENAVHGVINLFEAQLEERGIEVDVKVNGSLSEIYLDPLKLETILFNLIGNATKYSYPNSKLKIEVEELEKQQTISICNEGDGILAVELPYVFDRFFQSGSVQSGEGSGVGLALTKELVELHKGEISVTSNLKEFTCFMIKFQKGMEHLTSDQIVVEAESIQIATNANQGAKVLVVEDNADMRHYLYELLSEKFKVSLAENGQDALNKIESIQPDLVITDYMMPQMDGVKFFRALKALKGFQDVPIVFLTARAIERDKASLLKEGVDDYILKPFDDKDLFSRINALLSLKGERTKYKSVSSEVGMGIEDRFLNQLRSTIFSSLSNPQLTPTILCEALSISERTLYRKAKAATGFSPQAYIKEIRLLEARKMIEERNYASISEVAYAVGFEHLSHFSASYKERFGKLASEKEGQDTLG